MNKVINTGIEYSRIGERVKAKIKTTKPDKASMIGYWIDNFDLQERHFPL